MRSKIILALVVAIFALVTYVTLRPNTFNGAISPVLLPTQDAQPQVADYWKSFTKPSDQGLRQKLTSLQYDVTQNEGTETPFTNMYWNNKEEGIYVDIVSGEPLFSSRDKYDSGTGWPSFTKPLDPNAVTLHEDHLLGVKRTEVRSKIADSHLGHLFDDGPAPLGTRYCMNSASLRFVPKAQLVVEGYGEYLKLFE